MRASGASNISNLSESTNQVAEGRLGREKPSELNREALCALTSANSYSSSGVEEDSYNEADSSWEDAEGEQKRVGLLAARSPPTAAEQQQHRQNVFIEEFLRQRELSALRGIATEVRLQMERCCLPPFDVAAIEKYVVAVVERGRPKTTAASPPKEGTETTRTGSKGTTSSRAQKKSNHKRGGSSKSTSPVQSRPVTHGSAATPVDHAEKTRCTAAAPASGVHTTPLDVPYVPHSRHAAWYASAYKQLVGAATDGNGSGGECKTDGGCVPHHSGRGSARSASKPSAEGCTPPANIAKDNTTTKSNVATTACHKAAVADIVQLRQVLAEHEAATLAVLAAAERREEIMSKLRSFLAMAAEDLGVGVSPSSGHGSRSTSSSSGSSHGCKAAVAGSSRSASMRPWKTTRAVKGTSRRPKTHHFHRQKEAPNSAPPRRSAALRQTHGLAAERRYYKRGILYLLQRLQKVSVAVVMGVQAWRKRLSGSYPFVIHGRNYLLVMTQEMADLSQDPSMQALFQPQTIKSRREKTSESASTATGGKGPISVMDEPPEVLPECLQFYPLLTSMPHLMESNKPPTTVSAEDAPPFDFGESEAAEDEAAWAAATTMGANMMATTTTTATATTSPSPTLGSAMRRTYFQKTRRLPIDTVYIRRLRDAEAVLQREVAVQMRLLRRNFLACMEGRYPLLLRGVGELCGSHDGTIRLASKQRQREWYWHLHDMMSCLAEGSTALRKE
ncbi:hypothetical protein DQ04_04271020 [Trypanosoma grayi]|uniref:hypothetical protein n=1 Tax=Trypanosoma grayi TaxID=71804 RepID=UPI0004F4A9D7|nr:hypothetical protein DQ04_04271020 [Trypanosoma grayi]KEG10034.1 hypothetical protein DQ04_04271020 [Trypanosoma grayi]